MITQKELKELLHYDPDTGVFTWKVTRGGRLPGTVAGVKHHSGYYKITISGKWYAGHRLAWFYTYGEWPQSELDHINMIKDDNRICNLREADRSQNCINRPIFKNNTSGVTGVSFKKETSRYQAYICRNGKTIHLGYFISINEAKDARKKAELEYV